jgi:carboxymethylenebutenolidase
MNVVAIAFRDTPDGTFNGYLARAKIEKNVRVLLLPEMFGLTPAMHESAQSFAADGYTTLVPNLFWRSVTHPDALDYEEEDRRIAFDRLQAFDHSAAVEDIELAAAELRGQAGALPVVAIGHCIGGRLAVLALPRTSLAGAVSYYGLGISQQGGELARLNKPAQLHYGTADEHVPMTEVKAVSALAGGNPSITIYCYDKAGHSFCNARRPMYDKTAACLVHERTLAFLDEIGRRA